MNWLVLLAYLFGVCPDFIEQIKSGFFYTHKQPKKFSVDIVCPWFCMLVQLIPSLLPHQPFISWREGADEISDGIQRVVTIKYIYYFNL